MVIVICVAAVEWERRLGVFRLVVPQALTIRVISQCGSQVSVCTHLAIAMIGLEGTLRRINRDVIEVNTQPVTLGISIREQATLEHLVRREADSGNHIGRGEGGLLHFREIVFRITIELHYTDFDQWVVRLRPDLSQVERTVLVRLRLLVSHDLDIKCPSGVISAFDCLEQIPAIALPILRHNRGSFCVREILNTLLCAEVKLHPSTLVLCIDHREGVTSEAMHMPEGLGNSAVGHDDGDLMERLRKKSPEVPIILGAPKTGAGVTLDRMVEVREA